MKKDFVKSGDTSVPTSLVRDHEGRTHRLVEHMDNAAGGNWRALLAPPE